MIPRERRDGDVACGVILARKDGPGVSRIGDIKITTPTHTHGYDGARLLRIHIASEPQLLSGALEGVHHGRARSESAAGMTALENGRSKLLLDELSHMMAFGPVAIDHTAEEVITAPGPFQDKARILVLLCEARHDTRRAGDPRNSLIHWTAPPL